MRKLWFIFVLLFVAIFAVKAANTNYLTHCLTSGTAKPFVEQWDFYFMGLYNELTHKEFLDKLKEVNEHYKNGELKIVGKYVDTSSKILCKDKYGELLVTVNRLFSGVKPCITSAINPTEYWINKAKEVHHNKFDYKKSKYIGSHDDIEIICSKHGSFWQDPSKHITKRKAGCPLCGYKITSEKLSKNPSGWSLTDWKKQAKLSSRFDSFKVYIIKCWNEDEEFYKIGRTYLSLKVRFEGLVKMPYKYKVVKTIIGTVEEIFNLEVELKRQHKSFKYIPKKQFAGIFECFSKVNY